VIRGIAIVVLALVVAACGDAADEPDGDGTVVGADGVSVVITDTSRIVSLSGAITEIVYELGVGESIVAIDVTTVFPAEAATLPIVGVGRFLTAEAVLEQRPTLVIGDTQTAPREAIEQVRGAGVPVLITAEPTTFDGLYAKVALIGDALGVPDAAAELVDRMSGAIDATSASARSTQDPPRIAFVYTRGPDVILLFGAEMTTRPLIEAAGGIDAGTDSGVVGTVEFTPEALVAAQPDVIVMNSEGLEVLGGIDGVLEVPGFAATAAGRDRRILAYPEGDFLTFGPRVAESLQRLIADLQR
jgi:iron complex transport system substrate-binding protein